MTATTPPPPDPANPWAAPPNRPLDSSARWADTAAEHEGPGYTRPAGYASIPGQPGAYRLHPAAQALPPPSRLRGLGMTAVALLGVQAVLAVAAAGVSAWGVLSWSGVSGATVDVRLPADHVDLLLTLLRAPLSVLTGIAFVSWVWIATRNARNAGARVRYAPGWALGGWLVPFLSLWRPKQMIDDLWRASMPGVATGIDLRSVRKPVVVTCWWAAFLIGTSLPAVAITQAMLSVLGPNMSAIMSGLPPSVPVDMARVNETTAMYNLWAAVFMVVAAGLAMHFVLRITWWQDDRTTPHRGPSLPHEIGVSS